MPTHESLVKMYISQLRKGKISFEEIPEKYKEDIEKELNN